MSKVIITGASGMVGKAVLLECFDNKDITHILSIVRSESGLKHSKLKEVVHQDFSEFASISAELTGFDACFFCMGVSAAGISKAKYEKITIMVLAILTVLRAVLKMALDLLKGLDGMIQTCADEYLKKEEITLEEIDAELLESLEETEEEVKLDPFINGFVLSVVEDNRVMVGKTKRRYAVAKNKEGVILLKGESSFSANDQIKLSLTLGGAVINLSGVGSGKVHKIRGSLATMTIPLTAVNVAVTNGNDLPGTLAKSTSEIGKTFGGKKESTEPPTTTTTTDNDNTNLKGFM